MRYHTFIPLIISSILIAGCATGNGTRARTAPVPAGPVSTGTVSDTLIPAGTTIAIRANESIAAEEATPGRHYSAEIAQPIVNAQGEVIVPKGAPAQLTVLEASGGGVVGTSQLSLGLATITVGGETYAVQTGVVEEEGTAGLGANERTARTVGGGAALGALIGAIAGGGSGAAAGAAIGGAAGAAGQVLTRGEAVRVPAETVLTFRLADPIRLTNGA